jgi:hypothetical protein
MVVTAREEDTREAWWQPSEKEFMVATVREGIHDDNGQEKGTPERLHLWDPIALLERGGISCQRPKRWCGTHLTTWPNESCESS